jgi:hypothetical protein
VTRFFFIPKRSKLPNSTEELLKLYVRIEIVKRLSSRLLKMESFRKNHSNAVINSTHNTFSLDLDPLIVVVAAARSSRFKIVSKAMSKVRE